MPSLDTPTAKALEEYLSILDAFRRHPAAVKEALNILTVFFHSVVEERYAVHPILSHFHSLGLISSDLHQRFLYSTSRMVAQVN